MTKFRYTIEVECESQEQADTVIGERIYYDEDYGFDYTIEVVS